MNLHSFLNLRLHENGMNGNHNDEKRNKPPQVEEYSPRSNYMLIVNFDSNLKLFYNILMYKRLESSKIYHIISYY